MTSFTETNGKRAITILKNNGISIEDVKKMSRREIRKIPGIGPKLIKALNAELKWVYKNTYPESANDTARKIDYNDNNLQSCSGNEETTWDVAIDSSGNVYTTAGDGVARKLDSNGGQVWKFTGRNGRAYAVAIDSSGIVNIMTWPCS